MGCSPSVENQIKVALLISQDKPEEAEMYFKRCHSLEWIHECRYSSETKAKISLIWLAIVKKAYKSLEMLMKKIETAFDKHWVYTRLMMFNKQGGKYDENGRKNDYHVPLMFSMRRDDAIACSTILKHGSVKYLMLSADGPEYPHELARRSVKISQQVKDVILSYYTDEIKECIREANSD